MVTPISPISLMKLAQTEGVTTPVSAVVPTQAPEASGSIFDDMLGKAIDSLNSVSATEMDANRLIDQYVQGKAELSDVMLATSKMTITVQLAVSTITSAVTSFKEITQMAI